MYVRDGIEQKPEEENKSLFIYVPKKNQIKSLNQSRSDLICIRQCLSASQESLHSFIHELSLEKKKKKTMF